MQTNPKTFPAIQLSISYYSYLFSRFHSTSMAAAVPDNGTTTTTTAVPDNDKFGFKRPDMYAEKLTGTAIAYDRHVILCYKTHELWPSRVESSDAHPLPKVLAGALKARKSDIPVKVSVIVLYMCLISLCVCEFVKCWCVLWLWSGFCRLCWRYVKDVTVRRYRMEMCCCFLKWLSTGNWIMNS